MGIASLLSAAMKHVSWGRIASIAFEYGPDVVRKIKEQINARNGSGIETPIDVDQTGERIRELEIFLLNQEKLIQENNSKIGLLEQNCKTLQARLKIFVVVSIVSILLSLTALFLSIGK